MQFENRTGTMQADALWGTSGKDEMGVAVIAKATYDLGPRGELSQTQEAAWPVHFDNLETPYGLFVSEHTPFCKPKVDLILCGQARSRGARPTERQDVTISAGRRVEVRIRVFGDRIWERHRGGLRPTRPEPFTKLPLVIERAFGGAVTTDWGELPCMTNRSGRGWYLEEQQAEGGPLPNLEDPLQLIEHWDDHPQPIAPGPFPCDSGLRVELMPEDQSNPQEWDHLFLNWAHPRLMLDEAPAPGEVIRVEGVRHEGPLLATIPLLEARAHVRCDATVHPIELRLDTIIILGEERRAVFRWRGGTRFPIRPREHRAVVLSAA